MLIDFNFSIKHLFIILYIALIILTRQLVFSNKLYGFFEYTETINIPTLISLMQLTGIFLDKIRKKQIISKNIDSNNMIDSPEKNVPVEVSNKILKFYAILITCGIFEGIRYYYSIYLRKGKADIGYYISTLLLIEIMIYSYFFLGIISYSHHFLCVGIFFISDILNALKYCLYNDFSFINIFLKMINNYMNNGFDFLFSVLKLCLEKYMLEFIDSSPFLILYYEGIVQVIGFSIMNIIYILKDFFINEINEFGLEQLLFLKEFFSHWFLVLIYCVLILMLKILELLINESFGPYYFGLTSTSFIFLRFYDYILIILGKEDAETYIVLDIFYYIGYIIGVCIFCELIIINALGLGKNTKKNLHNKKKTDINQLEEEIDNMNLTDTSI